MTFRLTPAMSAELRAGVSPIAPLIEIAFPDHTLRHVVGSIEVMWGDRLFAGEDERFGVLDAAGTLMDGVGDDAPDWLLTFRPPSSAAVEDLTRANVQGSEVSGWLAVIDRATGLLIPEPIRVFSGSLDMARLKVGKDGRSVEWRCVSALEVFHDTERGMRLSDATHQMVWPGETGLANMTGIERTSYWGVEKVPAGVTYGTGGGGGSEYLARAL
ncbi:hypothetical protein [Sphingomonas sp. Leaf4]|uniref:hypothetical protein n=1 Tax=Sphingomonas sp. Leaf4 TaxID=2876553 RepID=UPI001E4E1766|nr:hypothetical protein [Sphingomonas sp. Leaf4]